MDSVIILLLFGDFCSLVGLVFFIFICIGVGLYHLSAYALGGQKRALEPLELEVKGNCGPLYMSVRNRTQVLWKDSEHFYLLNHLFSPCFFVFFCFEIGSHVVQPGIQLTL